MFVIDLRLQRLRIAIDDAIRPASNAGPDYGWSGPAAWRKNDKVSASAEKSVHAVKSNAWSE